MKKIIKKIKHWLIRKLGGFTEQRSAETIKIMTKWRTPEVKKIEFGIEIPAELCREESEVPLACKRVFAEKLYEEAFDLMEILTCDEYNFFERTKEIKATMYVIKPEDGHMIYNS